MFPMLRVITSYCACAAARSSSLANIDFTPLLLSPPADASLAASISCFSSLSVAAGRPSNIQLTPSLSYEPCFSSSACYDPFFCFFYSISSAHFRLDPLTSMLLRALSLDLHAAEGTCVEGKLNGHLVLLKRALAVRVTELRRFTPNLGRVSQPEERRLLGRLRQLHVVRVVAAVPEPIVQAPLVVLGNHVERLEDLWRCLPWEDVLGRGDLRAV